MPIRDCKIGLSVKIFKEELVNLYECSIGDESQIGPFVEIQRGVNIGPKCKISSHTFICSGVTLGTGVFVGHGVTFTNDKMPKAVNKEGDLQREGDWEMLPTIVEDGVSIGSGATILCGIKIGKNATIGAGSVVTKSVPEDTVVYGNPAR